MLAGVGELNWRVKAGGLGQKVSAYSDKYCLSEGEISNQDFYSKDFCDNKNFFFFYGFYAVCVRKESVI